MDSKSRVTGASADMFGYLERSSGQDTYKAPMSASRELFSVEDV
jgi:hypothetical protein